MTYKWLFIVQNFEIKGYQDSAARAEVVAPITKSSFVNSYSVLCFDRTYDNFYKEIISENIVNLNIRLKGKPVVIYGAGIHTQQHLAQFKQFNIKAIADRDSSLWGGELEGVLIISPDDILQYSEHVVISSKAYEQAIYEELSERLPALSLHRLYYLNDNNAEFNQQMQARILKEVECFEPDIIFYCPTHPSDCLPVEHWLEIKKKAKGTKFITVWWDYDEESENSPYLAFERDCLQWNDLCIENSNITRIENMKKGLPPYQFHHNTEKVVFHPTIFDPDLFYFDSSIKKKYDIALFGSAAGHRKKWIDFLQRTYKERFHHIGGVMHGEKTLNISDYAKALQATKVCINTQTYPFREQCKGKVREALACGVALLEEDNAQTRKLLDSGNGILYFYNQESLLQQIERLLDDDDMLNELVNQGQAQWQLIGRPDSWVQRLLDYL
ncbi:glycosyltransferase [Thalassotalea sp. G2M2-11]|uniref:glycosyltransferase n=1 Tax=Thalassotalea sp. G2M2-11 TaxID=2787627 RepID=UPI0019D1D9B5|nr:glycosyltransferase [Thalassotalea sp. G2M2-11]